MIDIIFNLLVLNLFAVMDFEKKIIFASVVKTAVAQFPGFRNKKKIIVQKKKSKENTTRKLCKCIKFEKAK